MHLDLQQGMAVPRAQHIYDYHDDDGDDNDVDGNDDIDDDDDYDDEEEKEDYSSGVDLQEGMAAPRAQHLLGYPSHCLIGHETVMEHH